MNTKTLLLIVSNELCERFCFYGLRSLLFSFLRAEYLLSVRSSTAFLHLFISMSYLFTLLGGIVSDMVLGKYNTIVTLGSVYLVGTFFLTYASVQYASQVLILASLMLISLGTGGIKPCVAAFGGDQLGQASLSGRKRFFDLFYFAINIGSMASMILSPILSDVGCLGKPTCYPLAFGASSTLLGVSMLLFISGKGSYIIKPVRKQQLADTFRMVGAAIKTIVRKKQAVGRDKTAGISTASEKAHYLVSADDQQKLVQISKVLLPAIFFWMLYDQQSSSWVEQGSKMSTHATILGMQIDIVPSQMQAFNSIFTLAFIPTFSKAVYPMLAAIGISLPPVERMSVGIGLVSISFFMSAFIQHKVDVLAYNHQQLSILWQLPQYVLLTAGEVMLNITGLEYVYSEAPESMNSLSLSMWLLTVAAGNIVVMLLSLVDVIALLSIPHHDTSSFILYGVIGLFASIRMFLARKPASK
ncbi:proton-dependent oligopeptide transport protein [Ordospora pajunii]|uniref:proton-dependent oligopeptide transport protein n=1 Tax=Ordospora pajunii TaxID=3039483 RepID=UPI0029527A83|nr:proton-dependent oligopeptide transport protein [Ordospora pajunii]KAH9410631.1 proton-dependent oligopeptide transport protein [Ordospora pajunii]